MTDDQNLENRVRELETALDLLTTLIATMIHTQETTNERLTMHMAFIRRIAAQTGSTIAPSFAEALASNDVELIQAHLANFEAEISH